MERRKFTREYKLEAVKLIQERGVLRCERELNLDVERARFLDVIQKRLVWCVQMRCHLLTVFIHGAMSAQKIKGT